VASQKKSTGGKQWRRQNLVASESEAKW